VTPHKISAVSFSNILNMNGKKFRKLILTALTPILVPCSESEKLRTKSWSTAMQVVQYTGHSAKIVKHTGSSRDDIERDLLIKKVQEWIGKCTMQSNLFPEQKQNVLIVE